MKHILILILSTVLYKASFSQSTYLFPAGKVGINTTNPTADFQVNGSVRLEGLTELESAAYQLVCDSTGSIYKAPVNAGKSSLSSIEYITLLEKIEALSKEVDSLTRISSGYTSGTIQFAKNESAKKMPLLYDCVPNPVRSSLSITCYVPDWANNFSLRIDNSEGKMMQVFNNSKFEERKWSFSASNWQAGTYFYTLYVDGNKIDTKKFILMH